MRALERDDVIAWIECPSLVNKGEMVWVPAQMLFVGYKLNKEKKETFFCPGFSTGTASHTSLEAALTNAIIEFVQIDSFIVNWYTSRKSPRVHCDEKVLIQRFPNLLGADSTYEVVAYDLTLEKKIPITTLGFALLNKKDDRPLVVYGVQGAMDPVKAFYRGLMEATALIPLGFTGPVYAPKEYFNSPVLGEDFLDLDKNVAFYMHPTDAKRKRDLFMNKVQGQTLLSRLPNYETKDLAQNLAKLIEGLRTVSEYAVYLDITPAEVRSKGWYVMRVFIPELVTMCLPGVPYRNHERMLKAGGVTNEYPHPAP